MNRILIFCILSCYLLLYSACRKKGCTDRNALNFDPSATESDGSCRYGSKADELSFTGNCDKGDTTLVSLDSVYNECTLTCFGEAIKYKFSLFIASSVDGGTITTLSDTTPKNIYWGGDAERTLLTFRSRKVLVPDYPKVLTVTYTFESTNPMGEKLTQSCKRSYRKMAGSNITKVQNVKLYGSKATGPQFYSFVKMRGVPKDSGDLMPSFIDLAFSDHSDIGSTFFSPIYPDIKWTYSNIPSWSVKNATYLKKVIITPAAFNSMVNDQTIRDSTAVGMDKTFISLLNVGDVVAFKLANNKRGFILVTGKLNDSETGYIVFDYLIQN